MKPTCLLPWIIATFLVAAAVSEAAEKFKVFILAGQSNMEGKAKNSLLEHQAKDPETAELFKHLRDKDAWVVRNDAWIKFFDRHGGLTIGYGSPDRTGVELEFGTTVANRLEEPILIIKTAWGGHSLYERFRSPSAGLPSEDKLTEQLANARQRVREENEKHNRNAPIPERENITATYGASYRDMVKEVEETLKNVETLFPSLAGMQPELAGFVWFQGWNDQYNGAELEYASNLEHFINDTRKDLNAPHLPFVVGVMGQNGSEPASGAMLAIQQAQLAMEKIPAFKGNVRSVRTDVLIDKQAEAMFPTWRENAGEWEKVGSDFPYHYYGSAIWFNRIGKAFGDAMLNLLADP